VELGNGINDWLSNSSTVGDLYVGPFLDGDAIESADEEAVDLTKPVAGRCTLQYNRPWKGRESEVTVVEKSPYHSL